MKNEMTAKIKSILFFAFYFLSACSCFTLICLFKPLRVKVFFFITAIVICAYCFIKKKELLIKKRTKNITAMALCIESVCFFDFYYNAIHVRERIVSIISKTIPISWLEKLLNENIVYVFIGIALCSMGFLFVKTVSPYFLRVIGSVLRILKKHKTSFLILLSVCILSFVAVIRANYYYTDDLGRTVYGYGITGTFSRYLANILSEVFHGNSWLADVSPLPQIIALVIISIAAILLLHIISETIHKQPTKWSFIALIPVCLSPYFLSCLSYKYDAPYMALSVLVSILPLVFMESGLAFYSVTVFISMLAMCATYQVSSGVFPMLVAMIMLLMWIQKAEHKKIFRLLLSSAISYSSALIVFRLVIMTPISEDNYVDAGVSISNLFPNIKIYFNLLNNDLPTIWKALFSVCFVFLVIIIVAITHQKKVLSILTAIFVSICSFLLSFGVYIVFNKPLFSTRAFYGVGVFLSIICCVIFLENRFNIAKLPVVCLSWFFVVYCFIYGNALNIQKEYIDFRTEQIINDCNNLDLLKKDNTTKLQTIGTAGYQRAVKNMIEEYPLLERQIPVLLSASEWSWGTFQFREYYGLNIEIADIGELQLKKAALLKETYYYSIYQADDVIVIELKDVEKTVSK
ncbi:MAG: glucosyltransferase domain-containing protein [Clostridia bacterium]|nr:glucosyltransferase domain-containing protein [Clostridia bacterium]